MTDESENDKEITGKDITTHAQAPAQQMVGFVLVATPDILTAIVALETAKQVIFMMAKRKMPAEDYEVFAKDVERLLRGFDGCQDAAAALGENAFMGPSGNA